MRKKISSIIAAVAIVAAMFCFAYPVNDYVQTKAEYDEIIAEVIIDNQNDSHSSDDDNDLFNIDWDKLLSINNHIIAWIDIPDTNISYPVMRVDDNNEYLRKNVYGELSRSGVIFVDSATISPFNGCNTIVYGHNMLNGQMFSQLRNYKSEDYMREHQIVYIYFPDGHVEKYSVFSFMYADMYDVNVYDANISSSELSAYYDMINKDSATSVGSGNGDKLLMLSTCVNSAGQNIRNVVYACYDDEWLDSTVS